MRQRKDHEPRRVNASQMIGWLVAAVATLVTGGTLIAHHRSRRRQQQLASENLELRALDRAAADVYSELDLEKVLQSIVDQARSLVGARYGALSVVDNDNRIEAFVTSGIDAATRQAIGDPPRGRGLLGVALHRGEPLRLTDLGRDPRAAGFPEHHPPMRSLLAVPVKAKAPFRGNLYLAEQSESEPFSEADASTLETFAAKAAQAIDHAHLHRRLSSLAVAEERVRIAREMHDGMAQVLAYVNTKAQAAAHLLERQRPQDAARQVHQLSEAVRGVYADVREGIAALRAPAGPGENLPRALEGYGETWSKQSGIDLALDLGPATPPRLGSETELQVLRIVQESLANIRKHSGARRARLALKHREGALDISVEDDGRGFDQVRQASRDQHHGLAIMRERAADIGARLSVESRPGEGTRVRLTLPSDIKVTVSPKPSPESASDNPSPAAKPTGA